MVTDMYRFQQPRRGLLSKIKEQVIGVVTLAGMLLVLTLLCSILA